MSINPMHKAHAAPPMLCEIKANWTGLPSTRSSRLSRLPNARSQRGRPQRRTQRKLSARRQDEGCHCAAALRQCFSQGSSVREYQRVTGREA
jgi:hypothetical protein